jgi:hypothetical protein
MRKMMTAALAALTFGGAVMATALPAQARDHDGWGRGGYRYDYGRRHHGNDAGVAVAAGVVGLALGAALANNSGHSRSYSSGYYSGGYGYPGYYDQGYGYDDDAYRVCETSRWVWDPYIGRRILVRSRYAC